MASVASCANYYYFIYTHTYYTSLLISHPTIKIHKKKNILGSVGRNINYN